MWGSAWFSHQVLTPEGRLQAEVFPGPPDSFHADQGFGVFVPFGAPGELAPLVDFPDVGLGQEVGEELNGAGVDQLRFRLGMGVTAGWWAGPPRRRTRPRTLRSRLSRPSVQGLCAERARLTTTVPMAARESLTFWAWGPFIQGMVSIMVAGAPEASRMARNAGQRGQVGDGQDLVFALLPGGRRTRALLWLRETLM